MFKNNKLLWGILGGAIAGIFCGWFFGEAMTSVAWLGALFLDALKMTIIPLIVAAVISGVASIGDARKLGKIGGFTVLYYICTTAIAVLLGLIIVNIINPGVAISEISGFLPDEVRDRGTTGATDIIRSLIGSNIVQAAAETDLLKVIVFCILFAVALTTIGDRGKPVIAFFQGVNDVMMKLVMWVIYFAPVGIFAMISSDLGASGGGAEFWSKITSVGWYVVAVILGLLVHSMILFGILYSFSKRSRNYLGYFTRALLTAFGTGSSAATLPLTMESAIEAGVDERSVKFVLPLGATVNMDGTALYEAVAVMFIAQAYGIDMAISDQIVIFITATLAAIGAASIPQAGLVTMIIVLTAVDLPVEGIGLLLAVDWFLDRLRTTVNVWGDSVGVAVIEKVIIKPLAKT